MGAGTIGFGGAGGLGGGAVTRGSAGTADPPPVEGGLGGAPTLPEGVPARATVEGTAGDPLGGTLAGAAAFGAACVGAAVTGP